MENNGRNLELCARKTSEYSKHGEQARKAIECSGHSDCCGTSEENLRSMQTEVWLIKFQGEAKTLSRALIF